MKEQENKIETLMVALKGKDKSKLSLQKRKSSGGDWWVICDRGSKPIKRHAIGTQDEQIARRVFTEVTSNVSYGQSELGAIIQLNVAKLDRDMRERTWQDVQNSFVSMGQKESTLATYDGNWKTEFKDALENQLLVTTTAATLVDLYKNTHCQGQRYLKSIHNHARDKGWLVSHNLLPKSEIASSTKAIGGNTTAITEEQHLKIVAAMEADLANWDTKQRRMLRRNKAHLEEVRTMLLMLWEMGSSNADTRELTVDNVDWETGRIVFKRKKWRTNGVNGKRVREPIRWPMSKALKKIIRPLYDAAMAKKDVCGFNRGYLLPSIAEVQSCNVVRIFQAYMEVAGVPPTVICDDGQERKIIIHSYRYRMAEHLFEIGATEPEAKVLMGWNSREIMHAYSKGKSMNIPPLDELAAQRGHGKVIQMPKAA